MEDFTISKRAVDEDKVCKAIDIGSSLGGIAEGVFESSQLFFKVSETIPVVGTAISAGIAIINFIAGNSLSSDCSDKPFDEIKSILSNRFDRVEKALDRNYRAIRAVSAEVSQTRLELQQGFARVLQSIRSSRIEPIVLKLNSFIDFYNNEKGRIENLPHDEYLVKLKEEGNILTRLKDSRVAMHDSLHTSLNEITDGEYAIPENFTDAIASDALHVLCYGTHAYISIMNFLLDQYFYLAQYHYERSELKEFNSYIDLLRSTYQDFKHSLIGISNTDAIIPQVNRTLLKVKEKYKYFSSCDAETLCKFAQDNIEDLTKEAENIKKLEFELPTIVETPEKFKGKIQFKNPSIVPPIGDWIKDAEVRYAVQYAKDGNYSKVGDWSSPYYISDKVNPFITIFFDSKNFTRLIFRKFNEETPQLIAKFEGEDGREFKDINRDVFNAASNQNEDLALDEMRSFLENGADIDAVFEGGRTVLHAAVEANNIKLIEEYILKQSKLGINVLDFKNRSALHIAAEIGNPESVTFLIDHGANVNAKTKDGLTPLHIASKKGSSPVIARLLRAPSINVTEIAKNDFTPLHSAVAGGYHAIKALLSNRNVNINAQSNEGLTPLHLATINNKLIYVITLVKTERDCQNSEICKINVNIGNKDKMTALHFASMFGYLEIVKFLIKKEDTDINVLSSDNMTPLHYAVSFKRRDVAIELAKNKRADLNLASKKNQYPLHTAIETGQNDVAKVLLEMGAKIDAKTSEGSTALHIAAKFKNSEMAKHLIDLDAGINITNVNGSTPLHFAAESNDDKTVNILLGKGANAKALDKNDFLPIQVAVVKGNLEAARELVKHDVTLLKVTNQHGDTLVHLAAKNSNLDLMKYLLDEGCDINSKNKDQHTALCGAIEENNLPVIQYFIERGAEEYTTNKDGLDCIYIAVRKGYLDLLKYFVNSNKLDLNSYESRRNDKFCGTSANTSHFILIDAIRNNKIDIVKYIVEDKEISMDHFDKCCLLVTSSGSGHLDLVKYSFEKLLERKLVEIDCSLFEENLPDTPLYSAIINNQTYAMRYIVDQEAWVDCTNKGNDKIPLRSAIKVGNLEMVKYLLNKGAITSWSHVWIHDSALHDAASSGHLDIVRYLVEEVKMGISYGGDQYSYSPLHYAAILSKDSKKREKAEEVMKYLLCKGADISQKGVDDKTALDVASPKTKKNIQEFLNAKSCSDFLQKINSRTRKALYSSDSLDSIDKKSLKYTQEKYGTPKMVFFDKLNGNVASGNRSDFIPSSRIDPPKYQSGQQFQNNLLNYKEINNTLLLLDVLVKKFTGQKYYSTSNQILTEHDARSQALEITSKFEDLMNILSKDPIEEVIDLAEVHSNIFKAIMLGKNNSISKILCSYARALEDLNPDETKKLLSAFMRTHSDVTHIKANTSDNEFGRYLMSVLPGYCANEAGMKNSQSA